MTEPAQDLGAQLAGLRLAGAADFDAVTFRYLQTLSERVAREQGEVRRLLEVRLAQGLQRLQGRFEQAQKAARHHVARQPGSVPPAPLGELLRYIVQQAPQPVDAGAWCRANGARPELKSVQHFRATWSKLSVDKQVAQALDQAPRNAGPINSHMLVLRSLALMRELSPAYLNRFMASVDALLCLDESGQARTTQTKKVPRLKVVKK
ncbi:MAG: DUF2894 domain-containing protein [Rhodoferax sp.]|nr:DUF2894 domain-containing protein [Rhodoferax sp.]